MVCIIMTTFTLSFWIYRHSPINKIEQQIDIFAPVNIQKAKDMYIVDEISIDIMDIEIRFFSHISMKSMIIEH